MIYLIIFIIIVACIIFLVAFSPASKNERDFDRRVRKRAEELTNKSTLKKAYQKSPKSKFDNKNKNLTNKTVLNNDSVFESSIERHAQIINESVEIIKKSKNLNTIESRYNTIIENWNLAHKYKNNVIPTIPNFIENLDADFNNAIVRVMETNLENYEIKISNLKTLKSIDNSTNKLLEDIGKAKFLIKNSPNEYSSLNKLDAIYNNLQNLKIT